MGGVLVEIRERHRPWTVVGEQSLDFKNIWFSAQRDSLRYINSGIGTSDKGLCQGQGFAIAVRAMRLTWRRFAVICDGGRQSKSY
jgi:hypothetical protein